MWCLTNVRQYAQIEVIVQKKSLYLIFSMHHKIRKTYVLEKVTEQKKMLAILELAVKKREILMSDTSWLCQTKLPMSDEVTDHCIIQCSRSRYVQISSFLESDK